MTPQSQVEIDVAVKYAKEFVEENRKGEYDAVISPCYVETLILAAENQPTCVTVDEWRPISTYVKTPRHVMVYTKNGAMMFSVMHDHIWYGSGTSGVSKIRLQDEWEPTHYMIIPNPPQMEE